MSEKKIDSYALIEQSILNNTSKLILKNAYKQILESS